MCLSSLRTFIVTYSRRNSSGRQGAAQTMGFTLSVQTLDWSHTGAASVNQERDCIVTTHSQPINKQPQAE
jgi:hypothetical protein